MSSLKDRLQGKMKNGSAAEAPAPSPVPTTTKAGAGKTFLSKLGAAAAVPAAKPEPVPVVPPDAPPSDAYKTIEDVEAAAPKKRGRPKKKKEAAPEPTETAEAAPEAEATTKATQKAKTKAKPFVLYVDCAPIKGSDDEMVLFEDWFGPALFELNEWAEAEKKLPDYRLLGYSEEKTAFALAVQNQITKSTPPVLVVATGNQQAKEALAVLIPHASQVIQAFRR